MTLSPRICSPILSGVVYHSDTSASAPQLPTPDKPVLKIMSPARNFIDGAIAIKMMKAGVGIGLQRALEVRQMEPWMFSLAILRISEPNGWSDLETCRSIVAHISPKPSRLGLSVAGGKHWDERVVRVNLGCRQNMFPDLIDQWSKQLAGSAHPRPGLSDPSRRPRGHRSETGDRAASGLHISKSEHAQAVLDLADRARSGELELVPQQPIGKQHRRTSAERDESPCMSRGCAPVVQRYPHRTCAAHRRNRGNCCARGDG